MFYKFNNFIGRIAPSTQAEAYAPQGLSTHGRGPSVLIFDTKATKPAVEPTVLKARPAAVAEGAAQASTAASAEGVVLGVVPSNSRYQKLMQKQNVFLKNDGKLVWQKLGGRDRMSYYMTLGLMLVGTVLSFNTLFKMSFPRKAED